MSESERERGEFEREGVVDDVDETPDVKVAINVFQKKKKTVSLLTQDHRVLSHDAHGEGALPDSLEGVLDLEPEMRSLESERVKRSFDGSEPSSEKNRQSAPIGDPIDAVFFRGIAETLDHNLLISFFSEEEIDVTSGIRRRAKAGTSPE